MTKQATLTNICPLFGEADCQYLSQERTTRPFTKLVKNQTNGMYDPVGMGSRKVVLGLWCNNHILGETGWVEEMNVCPKRWALHRGVTKKEGKKK